MTPPRTYSWLQEFLVPTTWSPDDGRRRSAARFFAPARDTPRRWVQTWAALFVVGIATSLISEVRDGFSWSDVFGVPFLLYVAAFNLLRAKRLLFDNG